MRPSFGSRGGSGGRGGSNGRFSGGRARSMSNGPRESFGSSGRGRGFGGSDRGRFSGGPRGRGGAGRGGPRGRGGIGSGRGGRGRGGIRNKNSGSKKSPTVETHQRFGGVYVSGGKTLCTMNLVPGITVYGEKRVSSALTGAEETIEFRVWNPYRSKLAAGIYNGIEYIYIAPGKRVLYLGAASGTTVSHVSDIVGSKGVVFAVEFSSRSGRDLEEMTKRRPNIVPIIEDARHPWKYRMVISGLVDCIFMDIAQPDQARIMALNAKHFLKEGGGFAISIKANCVDSTLEPEIVFATEVAKLKKDKLKPKEQVTLEPFERGHALVTGLYKLAQ